MSIQKRPGARGNTYRVMWRDRDGGQRSKSFDTLSAAKRFDAEVRLGVNPQPSSSSMTVADWVVEWFGLHSREWALGTVSNRKSVFDRWVLPLIGSEQLDRVSRKRVREMRADAVDRGATNYTANKCVTELSAALGAAVDNEILDHNPCLGIKKLPTPPANTRAMTPAEVEAIRRWMPTTRDRLIVSLIAYGALRPGEARALQWKHIGADLILVEQAAQGSTIATTKTRKSRSVPICSALADDIAEAERGAPDDLVVPGERGGVLNWRNWYNRVWLPAMQKAGLSGRSYDLRHTFASLAVAHGAPVTEVQAALGHSRASTTLDIYTHQYAETHLATVLPGLDAAIRDARTSPAATRPPLPSA